MGRAGVFQVVTFARALDRGNPAFVLSETGDASDAALAILCTLLRTDLVAVVDGIGGDEPALRFVTPAGPHPGAGHASLAAAHVALARTGRSAVTFRLPGGERRAAQRDGTRIAIAYPVMAGERVERADDMAGALGARPVETVVAPFGYVGIYEDAGAIAAMAPDMARVAAFDRTAVIATAPSEAGADLVVRVFAPNAGLPEDPVCGTAHRIIVPYWARRLGRGSLHSRHLSPRGGDLYCEARGETVVISGESRLALEGTMELPP